MHFYKICNKHVVLIAEKRNEGENRSDENNGIEEGNGKRTVCWYYNLEGNGKERCVGTLIWKGKG